VPLNVIAVPDIVEHELADEDEFLVLACDGKVCNGQIFVLQRLYVAN